MFKYLSFEAVVCKDILWLNHTVRVIIEEVILKELWLAIRKDLQYTHMQWSNLSYDICNRTIL